MGAEWRRVVEVGTERFLRFLQPKQHITGIPPVGTLLCHDACCGAGWQGSNTRAKSSANSWFGALRSQQDVVD
jgi:hypothetical protein